jgi:hypothetical protein
MKSSIRFITSLAAFLSLGIAVSSADQVILRNGDILNGKVLSMTTNALVLQDDSLGTMTLPRTKVSNITFGQVAAAMPPLAMANAVQASPEVTPQVNSQPNSDPDLQAMAREIREHSNLVQEVEAQVLGSSASPAAQSKFDDIIDQLSSGQLDMNGLRSQVQSAADQLQEYKKEMGPDAGEEVDSYLSILNNFLQETAPTNGASP